MGVEKNSHGVSRGVGEKVKKETFKVRYKMYVKREREREREREGEGEREDR